MRVRSLTALALAATLPACATDPAPPPALSAETRQYRSDVPLRLLSVTTTNDGDHTLRIEQVQLQAGGFVALPSAPADVLLKPGERVDVPVAYGRPRCGSALPDGVDAARMLVRVGTGAAEEVVVTLAPAGGLLPRLHASECAQAAVREAVSLSLAPGWVRRGERLEGALLVQRVSGDAPVEVVEPAGHIVFTVSGRLPARLSPGSATLSIPVSVTPTRCDGHALSQNSRGAVFPFVVAVGEDEPVRTPATAGPELQAQLEQLATDVCVPGS